MGSRKCRQALWKDSSMHGHCMALDASLNEGLQPAMQSRRQRSNCDPLVPHLWLPLGFSQSRRRMMRCSSAPGMRTCAAGRGMPCGGGHLSTRLCSSEQQAGTGTMLPEPTKPAASWTQHEESPLGSEGALPGRHSPDKAVSLQRSPQQMAKQAAACSAAPLKGTHGTGPAGWASSTCLSP